MAQCIIGLFEGVKVDHGNAQVVVKKNYLVFFQGGAVHQSCKPVCTALNSQFSVCFLQIKLKADTCNEPVPFYVNIDFTQNVENYDIKLVLPCRRNVIVCYIDGENGNYKAEKGNEPASGFSVKWQISQDGHDESQFKEIRTSLLCTEDGQTSKEGIYGETDISYIEHTDRIHQVYFLVHILKNKNEPGV